MIRSVTTEIMLSMTLPRKFISFTPSSYGSGIRIHHPEGENQHDKHDAARRAFLVRAAVGAGAVAGAGLVPDAHAQLNGISKRMLRPTPSNIPAARKHGAFFNHDDAATIAAFTERLMPGAPDKPGASDAGVSRVGALPAEPSPNIVLMELLSGILMPRSHPTICFSSCPGRSPIFRHEDFLTGALRAG